ncbi:SRPBCC family protein [Sporichthya polymorpha]|uniref:SRPBCC family protein n=1 Tax=Sporichthya polymorpha TaxID=35751 RepID=UPI000526C091|nr:SRPBCC family protein [Sporichthya polymorpha]
MRAFTESVTVHIQAPPRAVWDLITDVTRIGEFSPETLEGRWIDGATGPAVGAKFQGHVKRNGRGPMYWTTCRITRCEPERDFAFVVEVPGMGAGVNTWRYQLAPAPGPDGTDGTDVTESFELTPSLFLKIYWLLAGPFRAKTNIRGMTETLHRIKAVAEKSPTN